MSARDEPKAALPESTDAAPTKPALKDRIADLNLGMRAKAVGASLAERMKAAQAAAGGIRLDKLNREALKAGRDGLAAKVESLLKPRRPEDGPPQPTAASPSERAADVAGASASPATATATSATTRGAEDIQALKAKLDEALRASTPRSPAPPATRETGPTAPPTPADVTILRTGAGAQPNGASSRTAKSTAGPPMTAADVDLAPAAPAPPDAEPRTTRTARARAAAEVERRRPVVSLAMIATALVTGGVLHILTVFAIPFLNTGSAFDRLRWDLERNTMRVFPADPDGKSPLPFLSADMRYAMCRYDLTQGSVQVSAVLPDLGWSLALYTPQGDNFYAVPGQDGKAVTATFSLNLASDRLLLPVPGMRRADTDAAQVTSPQREGVIVIRAPNLGPAYQPTLEEALTRATCRPAVRR